MDAIILAGGRSQRMGTDKLELHRAGRSLLQQACDAVAPHAQQIVVAGQPRHISHHQARFVPEDPPFGGPVAGIAAALEAIPHDDQVIVIAGDLVRPEAAVARLLRAADALEEADGVVLADQDGRAQYLTALYRTAALRLAIGDQRQVRDLSVRGRLSALRCVLLAAEDEIIDDVDTPDKATALGLAPGAPHNEEQQ